MSVRTVHVAGARNGENCSEPNVNSGQAIKSNLAVSWVSMGCDAASFSCSKRDKEMQITRKHFIPLSSAITAFLNLAKAI